MDVSNSKTALNAVDRFLEWYSASDPSQPNDTEFLARLTKVRVALHKAKQKAVAERVKDVVASGEKVVVFREVGVGDTVPCRHVGPAFGYRILGVH